MTFTIHDTGLSTIMTGETCSMAGNLVKNRAQLYVCEKWQSRFWVSNANPYETLILHCLNLTGCIGTGFPEMTGSTAVVYRDAVAQKFNVE
jgi:transcription initiation factor TFIIIB Brf1 subunit/transcription initiation factor TFIIB